MSTDLNLPLPSHKLPEAIASLEERKYIEVIKKYGPIIFFHSSEKFMPSSFNFIEPYVNAEFPNLPLKDQLDTPTQRYAWFLGEQQLGAAPCYAMVVDYGTSYQIYFYYFYPYNLGKKVARTEFGNHAGDWEYVSIVFNNEDNPIRLQWAHHGKTKSAVWDYRKITMEGTHPVFFAAYGSHGLHYKTGRHYYISKWVRFIYDSCNAGKRCETWRNCVLITPENYNGQKRVTFNQDLQSVSLDLPNIGNWTTYTYFGQRQPIGRKRVFGKSIYRLGGYNRIPCSRFK